jgi:hypothetical protein
VFAFNCPVNRRRAARPFPVLAAVFAVAVPGFLLAACSAQSASAPDNPATTATTATTATAATAATADPAEAFADLLVTAVRAAVVAPEPELRRWFSWPWYGTATLVDDLIRAGRLRRLDAHIAVAGSA